MRSRAEPGTPRALELVQVGRNELLAYWEPPEPSNAPISHYRVTIYDKLPSTQADTSLRYTTNQTHYLHAPNPDMKCTTSVLRLFAIE